MTKYTEAKAEIAMDFAQKTINATRELRESIASVYALHEAGLCTLDELDEDKADLLEEFAATIETLVDDVTPQGVRAGR